jgi:predicted nucleotidyltransferase
MSDPDRCWHVRELTKHINMPEYNIPPEIFHLVDSGILDSWRDEARVYVQANKSCPIFEELRSLMIKSLGVVELLQDALAPVCRRIVFAFVFGSVAEGTKTEHGDIHLMVVGSIQMTAMTPLLLCASQRLSREVSPVLFSQAEFNRKAHKNIFMKGVLRRPLLFVVGTREVMDGIGPG